ncbi:ABC transporter permease [Herbaspirillum sp. GCM10030257]|uniref:ABC transporter permease n=1 Tax=Herbaspirillum sp. GCM10030257 TaxID=3273393 RepID=UPI0036230F25
MMTERTGLTKYSLGFPAMIFAALMLATSDFRSLQNFANLGGQLCAPIVAALGQLFVVLVGGIDLSIGSVVSLAGSIMATQSDPITGMLLVLVLGVAVGLVNGAGIAYTGVHPLVMTLSTGTFLQGLAYVILPIPGGTIAPSLVDLASGAFLGVPKPVMWAAGSTAAVWFILQRTSFGIHVYAIGAQPHSAYLNGVPVKRTLIGAYVASALLGALAGVLLSARIATGDPTMGASFALESVAAVALGGVALTGGVGSVAGVIAGSVGLGLLANGINLLGISPFMRGAITGLLLLIAVSMQRRKTLGL